MTREITGKNYHLRPVKTRSNPYRILLFVVLILAGIWLIIQFNRGQVTTPFNSTPTPTRSVESYALQAQVYFAAGKLDDPNSQEDVIDTYLKALQVQPDNPSILAELARIQAYSSSLLSTDQERLARLEQARDNIRQAADLAPDDSTILATEAFVLDWNASSNLISEDQREAYLAEAESAANRAYLLDPQNALALAYYAEVLLDQQKWDQAQGYAEQAVLRAPDSMDAHRVNATVLEYLGLYRSAIEEYQKASDLAPNLTFLLLRIGLIYRNLGNKELTSSAADSLYETALSYFDRAARINDQLGIKDPSPYIAIAKTYTQQGQFFIASRNAEKALRFSPTSADTYGQLGSIYVQARNYESALPALRCSVEGCSAAENTTAQEFIREGSLQCSVDTVTPDPDQGYTDADLQQCSYPVDPLPLTNLTVAYYYIRYGSVLAYLSDSKNGYCEKSLALMQSLRKFRPEDSVLMENVSTNEDTCRLLMGNNTP
jgi:tetratricopeptide (TPR) repeat protein